MAQSLVPTELVTLADDLKGSTVVETYYLDEQRNPQKVIYCYYSGVDDIRIELRPRLVVRTQMPDAVDPEGYSPKTVEIPLERVLIAKVLGPDTWSESQDDVQRALWVNGPHGKLLRLVP